jgi:hypothetical protein
LQNFRKLFIKAIQNSASDLFHPCPFAGKLSMLNLSISKDAIMIVPAGNYFLLTTVFDDFDSKIFLINTTFEIFE